MRDILFSHSYFLRFDPKQWNNAQPYAPLGTLYAAALARVNGYTVSLFDTMFAETSEALLPHLEKEQPRYFVLWDDGFNYLTKMCLTNMRDAAFRMITHAKARGCVVVVCSSDAADQYKRYLDQGADFILIGEGEQTLLELLHALDHQQTDYSGIAGLAYYDRHTLVKTPGRPVMKELDSLPFPAWDIIDMDPYRDMWMNSMGYFSMNMGTTRGCPFKCNWCAKPIYGNRYNTRSPENVVEELLFLKANYAFDHIWFCDDIFGLKPGWVRAFADLVEEKQLKFSFKIQSRVDLLLQEDNVRHLARAGCSNIWMGAESGSQKILDAMDKGTTVPQIYEATRLLKKTGIKASFFIQFGYPGETREDIESTVQMINTLLPYEIGISVSYPLPGTVFFERVKAQLTEKTNWTDSDELALMFSNTFPPAFYKQLHRYVHQSYRMHLAGENLKQLFLRPFRMRFAMLRKALSGLYFVPATWAARYRLHQLEKQ